jgi:hypothetical protein
LFAPFVLEPDLHSNTDFINSYTYTDIPILIYIHLCISYVYVI